MRHSDVPADVLVLIEEFQRSGVRELHVRSGAFELFLSNDPGARTAIAHAGPGPAAAAAGTSATPIPPATLPAATHPAAEAATPTKALSPQVLPQDAVIVTAPYLGTFYRSPKPGAAPYVEQGALIAAGDELCLIEVMKLFTVVSAGAAGRIHAILVEDGAMVEAGQPLFAVVAP